MTRHNLCPNPAAKNNVTGWGGVASVVRATGLTGLPRTTAAQLSSTAGGSYLTTPIAACAPGDVFTVSLYIKNDSAGFEFGKTIYIGYTRSSGGDVYPESFSTGTLGAVGNVLRLSYTTLAAPALATGIYLLLDNWNSGNVGFEFTGLLFEKVGALDTYADGDTSGWVWDGADGNSTSSESSGVTVADPVAGGASTGGTADAVAIGNGSGGSGTGGTPDAYPVVIPDPAQPGAGTGGTPDTASGKVVVHDQMVMPIAIFAQGCLVTEIGKVTNPPASVQIRPGASFAALVDSHQDECCLGIAYVRPGPVTPTSGAWPQTLASVQGPSASRGAAPYYAVTLELGVYRCLPTISNVPDAGKDEIPTAAQWLQATQEQQDDAAALRRVVCCLQVKYGNDGVLAGAVQPLENSGNCGGISLLVQVRAPACDCVG